MQLKEKKCKPCDGNTPSIRPEDIPAWLDQLQPEWEVKDNKKITRSFRFKNFRQALNFANKAGEIAEQEQHHPDLHVYYGKVIIDLTTHAINGLSENDFIMASKIDHLS